MTLLHIALPCGWKSKEVLCFLKGLCFKCILSFGSTPLGVWRNYLLLHVYLRVEKPSKRSTYHCCSSAVGSLACQHTFGKAVHRLGSIGSERLSHLPKVTGKQQHKDASLGLCSQLSLLSLVSLKNLRETILWWVVCIYFIYSLVGRNLCYFFWASPKPM